MMYVNFKTGEVTPNELKQTDNIIAVDDRVAKLIVEQNKKIERLKNNIEDYESQLKALVDYIETDKEQEERQKPEEQSFYHKGR